MTTSCNSQGQLLSRVLKFVGKYYRLLLIQIVTVSKLLDDALNQRKISWLPYRDGSCASVAHNLIQIHTSSSDSSGIGLVTVVGALPMTPDTSGDLNFSAAAICACWLKSSIYFTHRKTKCRRRQTLLTSGSTKHPKRLNGKVTDTWYSTSSKATSSQKHWDMACTVRNPTPMCLSTNDMNRAFAFQAKAGPHFSNPGQMEGRVDPVGWLQQMVYLCKDGHLCRDQCW